jgi:uncharacterized protein
VDMRINRATAVVVQQVPEAGAAWFLEWQRGITQAMEAFAGHQGTEVYPPPGGGGGEWVVVIGFEDEQSLQAWLDSPVRRQWVEKLQEKIGSFDLKVMHKGFGPWFAGCLGRAEAAPPGWKMAAVVLFGLYPTVMLLNLFPGPFLHPLGLALSMLIGNALSVAVLQWLVMPALSKLFGPWLAGNQAKHIPLTAFGTLAILGGLAVLAAVFRLVTG